VFFDLSPFGRCPKGSFLWLGLSVKYSRDIRVMKLKQPIIKPQFARDFYVMNNTINKTSTLLKKLNFFLSQIGLLVL
jgi:hypothetical protein